MIIHNVLRNISESVLAKVLLAVINEVGNNRIKTLIMADYRFVPMILVAKYCKNYSITIC